MAEKRETPPKYKQPVTEFVGRNLTGSLEQIDYSPKSHIRIWYNNQVEGYATHDHTAMEMILCIENTYTVIANSKTYHLNVGDILLIPPNMLHKIICQEEGTRFIFLINIDSFSNLEDYHTLDPVFMDAYYCSAITKPSIYQEFYANLMQMIDTYFSNDIFWETTIFSLLLKSYILIGKEQYDQSVTQADTYNINKHREHYDKFVSLLTFIDANYQEDLSLEQAADYIGFSKYHFSRLFKLHTNTTFYDYLSHKRVQAAQALLATDIPITDIAFQTGFNNLTTFCRCFKKCTNCSPTEYRNKFREEQVN